MDELIVGTYEGFLLGYVQLSNEDKLKQTFATQSHTGSVRCLSTAGKFLASGGTDDKVIVIDLKTRKEHTVLMHHDGTVNALSFTNNGTHLISGSEDGSLVVTRVGNWQIEKKWKKAHGGQAVVAVAVHPSDKLALSIGGDKTLRTWNLIKGRPAFTINLSSKGINMATEILFAPDADRFSLVSQQTVDIWTISKAGIEKRITCSSKPSAVQWISDEKIIVGLENGNIIIINVSNSQAVTCIAHKQRVKCIHFEKNTLYSASSSGEIKMWALSPDAETLTEQNTATAGCRITAMTLNRQSHFIKKEDESDTEDAVHNKELNSDDDDSNEDEKCTIKKKPGAFVTVSYDDTQNEPEAPPEKKRKVKKRNKHQKQKDNK